MLTHLYRNRVFSHKLSILSFKIKFLNGNSVGGMAEKSCKVSTKWGDVIPAHPRQKHPIRTWPPHSPPMYLQTMLSSLSLKSNCYMLLLASTNNRKGPLLLIPKTKGRMPAAGLARTHWSPKAPLLWTMTAENAIRERQMPLDFSSPSHTALHSEITICLTHTVPSTPWNIFPVLAKIWNTLIPFPLSPLLKFSSWHHRLYIFLNISPKNVSHRAEQSIMQISTNLAADTEEPRPAGWNLKHKSHWAWEITWW